MRGQTVGQRLAALEDAQDIQHDGAEFCPLGQFARDGQAAIERHARVELSTLLNAGVPLDRCLTITSELTERAKFRAVVLDVLRILKGGKSLADSLAAHPEYFGDLYVNMVRAGEAGGALAAVFDRLADFERSRDELRGYIISSMTYPALLVLVGLASVLVLLNFVVPRFATVFEESRMKIPLPTQIMLDASKFVQAYWLAALVAAVCMAVAFRAYVRSPAGQMWWDTLLLRVPLLGDAVRKAETARFARAMSTLVGNSVPLVQSINIAAAILNNKKIDRKSTRLNSSHQIISYAVF